MSNVDRRLDRLTKRIKALEKRVKELDKSTTNSTAESVDLLPASTRSLQVEFDALAHNIGAIGQIFKDANRDLEAIRIEGKKR